MDFIVDNPFAPVLLACLVTAAIFSTASWLTKWAWLATIAVPAVFLVAYVSTYQKIPPFPPVGAANKVFYVALAATLVAATDSFTIVPRSVLAGAVSLLASIWIGFAKLAEPNAETLVVFAAVTVGGAVALWGLDRVAAMKPPLGGSAPALASLAAVSLLSAPVLLFGGSSTSVALCLGLTAAAALLSLEGLFCVRPLGAAAVLGAGGGLLASLNTIALVARHADPFALSLIAFAPLLGLWAVRRLPPGFRDSPAVAWIVSGLATLSPLPVIVALLFLRHDNPLGT